MSLFTGKTKPNKRGRYTMQLRVTFDTLRKFEEIKDAVNLFDNDSVIKYIVEEVYLYDIQRVTMIEDLEKQNIPNRVPANKEARINKTKFTKSDELETLQDDEDNNPSSDGL